MANNHQNSGLQEVKSVPNVIQEALSDWQEHTAGDGRRYFYNKRTNMSSWEKPLELMTPLEKADASTVWKEFTNAEGKKFYYNKETKQTEWTIPQELKLAREQVEKEAFRGSHSPVFSTVNNTSLSPEIKPENISNSHDVANALDEASDIEIMTQRKRGRNQRRQPMEPPPDDLPAHSWLRFPDTLPTSIRNMYNDRLAHLTLKEIEVTPSLDWDVANDIGLVASIGQYLTQRYRGKSGEVLFTCHAWSNLFHIQEPVYRELVLEFFSTVKFNHKSTDYNDRTVFTFRLGGVSRQCSIQELGWRVGLYSRLETKNIHFLPFLQDSLRSTPDDFNAAEFWASIANGVYDPHAVESSLRSPIHRLLHRLISTSLTHRKGAQKVPQTDLFYLWCLLTPDTYCNIPFALASYLARKATGTRQQSPICGGHFITRLALSYGILTREVTRQLLRMESKLMGLFYLETMRVIRRSDINGSATILDIDAADDEEEIEKAPEQRRQRRRRRSPVHDEEPVIDLQHLASRIEGLGVYQDDIRHYQLNMQDQLQWLGKSLSSFFEHHGFTPPSPFPPALPSYPDWRTRFPAYPPPTAQDPGLSRAAVHQDSEDD